MSITTHAQTMTENISNNNDSGDQLDGLPPLSYRIVTRDTEKQDALRLVTDSIAQQRQVASTAVIFHPLCITALVAMCAVTYRYYQNDGYGTLMTMLSGIVIVYLSGVRFATSKYIQLAEDFRWKTWIIGPDGVEDTIIAAIYGEEIIGAVVLRLLGSKETKKKGNANVAKDRQGIIRAWTTRMRYRGKGVGSDLLEFAAQTARNALGPDVNVEFASDHANSVNPLPDMFCQVFQKRQERAPKALEHALRKGAEEK